MRNKKGAIEFSFTWIFAILAGIAILGLTIYGIVKFIDIQKTSISAENARTIGILTSPMETSFETLKRSVIIAGAETRIYTNCSNSSIFGKQIISTTEKSNNRWGETIINVGFENKYIFSENPVEGRKFYVFSKPFEFPFKVADLIYITSTLDKYCFVNPPDDIEDEIKDLRGEEVSEDENLFLAERKTSCPTGSIRVCFTESGCDITVKRSLKIVQKKNEMPVRFEGDSLMYAAIFSDREEYECQLDRLMNRTEQLFDLYSDKSKLVLQETGCNSELDVEFIQMSSLIKGFQNSDDLDVIGELASYIGDKNENAGYGGCRLW